MQLKKPLIRKGFGAAVTLSVLSNIIEGTETPPASPGFGETLASTIRNARLSPPSNIPSIPEPAASSGIPVNAVGITVLCATLITGALIGL